MWPGSGTPRSALQKAAQRRLYTARVLVGRGCPGVSLRLFILLALAAAALLQFTPGGALHAPWRTRSGPYQDVSPSQRNGAPSACSRKRPEAATRRKPCLYRALLPP